VTAASKDPQLPRWLFAEPGSPDVRVQRCLEAIRRAVEEYHRKLQVSIHFNGTGQSIPDIRVVPVVVRDG
jgi:hypothetical protein